MPEQHELLPIEGANMISDSAEVVSYTRDLKDRSEWLSIRKGGIGGSDASAIMGVSRYTSEYALWYDKRSTEEPEENTNEAMDWGNDLELVVAQRYAKNYGDAVVALPAVLRSKRYPFMFANLDFVCVDPSEQFPAGVVTILPDIAIEDVPPINAILEIKTNGIVGRPSQEWEDGGVPRSYELQGQHYSIVTGCQAVIFAALIGGSGLQVRGRLYNSKTSNDELIEAERNFWQSVIVGERPPTDGSESTFKAIHSEFPSSEQGSISEADDFVMANVRAYEQAKRESDAAELRTKELRAKLEVAFGGAESLSYEGTIVATFKSTKDGETVDTKNLMSWLEENHPETVRHFTIPKRGYRVLRLKQVK
jgi:putative phage-type endonuclease